MKLYSHFSLSSALSGQLGASASTGAPSATAALLALALAGCPAPSDDAQSAAAPSERAAVVSAPSPEMAHALAERARLRKLAATAAPRATSGPRRFTLDNEWTRALDLPPEQVNEVALDGDPLASAVRGHLGVIRPRLGQDFVILSTGLAVTANAPEPGTDFPPAGTAGDAVTLHLKLQVPAGATRMSLQYNFLSSESPDFVGTAYNDTFSIQLIDNGVARPAKELASVNASYFFDVSESRADNSGYDIYTPNPSGIDNPPFDLGLPDAGLTDFQSFHAAVTPNSELEVVLSLLDNGDGILDSAVLLDALQFSAIEAIDPNPAAVDQDGQPNQVRGVAADGATHVLLRMKVPDSGTATFTIDGGDENGKLSKVGELPGGQSVEEDAVVVGADRYVTVVYHAPESFNRGSGDDSLSERTVTISANFVGGAGGVIQSQTDLQVRRPPLVLTQGIWTSTADWVNTSLANDSAFTTTYVDRQYGCDNELRIQPPANAILMCPLVSAGPGEGDVLCLQATGTATHDAVHEALANLRRLRIAVTQVDMVAHGGGGVDVRKYIDSAGYRGPLNFGKGDINRLITINTPHRGSEVARLARVARDNATAPDTAPTLEQFLCIARVLSNAPVETGDIDALATNVLTLATNDVPSHAIYGTGARALRIQDMKNKVGNADLLYTSIHARGGFPSNPKILAKNSLAFAMQEHDLFSTVASQQGGLSAANTTGFSVTVNEEDPQAQVDSDFFHSIREADIADRVKALLNQSPASAEFGVFPAYTPAFAPDGLEAASKEEPRALAAGSLRILSPVFGGTVVAGSTISVVVEAQGGYAPRTLSVVTKGAVASVAVSGPGPYTVALKVPDDSLGVIRLLATALDDDEDSAYSQDVAVIAQTTATINQVSIVNQDPRLFGLGARRQLTVLGHYNDNVTRVISEPTTGTTYRSSNPGIADVTANGTIIALSSGITTVVAQNGMRQDSVTVTVEVNRAPRAVARGGAALTCLPPGALASVAVDGSQSFDPDGDALLYTWTENGVVIGTGAITTLSLAAGVHAVELRVSDGKGGVAVATLTATVSEDEEAPLVALLGGSQVSTQCGSAYSDEGATASDDCDGDLTAALTSTSNVDTAVPGDYQVQYQVSDQAGHSGVATRTVAVRDTEPPQISILGSSPAQAQCGALYQDPGATVDDVCYGDLTSALVTSSNVNIRIPGFYAVNYQVTDPAGQTTMTARAVTVADSEAPVLDLRGASPATTECGAPYHDAGAAAQDRCYGDLSASVLSSSNVNPAVPGSYQVSYTVTDPAGLSDSRARAVMVQDNLDPVLALRGASPAVTECGAAYTDAGATAQDQCFGDLSSAITTSSNVNTAVPGTYAVRYQVLDGAGHSSMTTRRVDVADRLPPQVNVKPMAELSPPLLFLRSFDLSDCAAALDACDGPVNINSAGQIVAIHSDERERTWRWDPGNDMVITGPSSFLLRQQRNFPGNGRVYEVEFTVRDSRGHVGPVRSCFLGVKTSRSSPTPINDGRQATVRPRTH